MQISIMLNQQQNGPRQCKGTIGGNLQDSENEENVQELSVQTFNFKIQHPWLNLNISQMQEEIKTRKSVHELTRNFSHLMCPLQAVHHLATED